MDVALVRRERDTQRVRVAPFDRLEGRVRITGLGLQYREQCERPGRVGGDRLGRQLLESGSEPLNRGDRLACRLHGAVAVRQSTVRAGFRDQRAPQHVVALEPNRLVPRVRRGGERRGIVCVAVQGLREAELRPRGVLRAVEREERRDAAAV